MINSEMFNHRIDDVALTGVSFQLQVDYCTSVTPEYSTEHSNDFGPVQNSLPPSRHYNIVTPST